MSEAKKNTTKNESKKIQRTSFVLEPNVQSDITALAHLHDKSVNQLVNEILADYANSQRDIIDEYVKLQQRLKSMKTSN